MQAPAPTSHTPSTTTPFYAQDTFITLQKAAAITILALGFINAAVSYVHKSYSGYTLPLLHLGSALYGAAYLQKVIANHASCQTAKIRRVIASAIMMLFGPVGIFAGKYLWNTADKKAKAVDLNSN